MVPTVIVTVLVRDPDDPSEVGRAAISRAEAAVRRVGTEAELRVRSLDSAEAAQVGAAVEPTVAVGDLVVSIGQAPLAGHLLRAITAALERES